MKPRWSRRFPSPIYLADGSVLRTLKDAANYIIKHKPPTAEIAAIPRLMEAAEQGASLETAEAAVRIALFHKLDFSRRP
jgi:hypothetical protein